MASISWASFILFGCASVFVNLPRIFSRSTWTSGQVRGDGLLKEPGSSPAFFRHSSLFPSFLPFSVIPAKAGIHFHRNETAEGLPEAEKYLRQPSAVRHGPRIKSGVTDAERARIVTWGDGLLKEPGFVARGDGR
jgi:hypothetical protein